MKKVMNLLYEIEGKANNIIERANDEKIKLHDELDKELDKLDLDIATNNKVKLDHLQSRINQELEQEKDVLISDSKKQLKELNDYFTTNYETLIKKTFNNVIGA